MRQLVEGGPGWGRTNVILGSELSVPLRGRERSWRLNQWSMANDFLWDTLAKKPPFKKKQKDEEKKKEERMGSSSFRVGDSGKSGALGERENPALLPPHQALGLPSHPAPPELQPFIINQ